MKGAREGQYYYDRSSNADDYFSLFDPGAPFEGQQPKIPEYCRLIVAENAHQPALVMLFQTLNTEAIPASHPAHAYFVQRSRDATEESGSWHFRHRGRELDQGLGSEAASAKNVEADAEHSKGGEAGGEHIPWSVPEGVDVKLSLSVAMAAMYGLEGRWLARPDEIDYEAEWARFEDVLFPLPLWEGYR